MNDVSAFFPVWDQLTPKDQAALNGAAEFMRAGSGTLLHAGQADCVGLFLIKRGLLRAYIVSDEGREVTLYRLFDRDICLFSASCLMSSIQFDVMIEAEKDSEFFMIPPDIFKSVMLTSAPLANYTNELMASRFSDVMWLMDKVLFKGIDVRLASFLSDESALEQSDCLAVTHERIAAHIGTAREVVSRMLKYFQSEGIVKLSRGGLTITDKKKLSALAG